MNRWWWRSGLALVAAALACAGVTPEVPPASGRVPVRKAGPALGDPRSDAAGGGLERRWIDPAFANARRPGTREVVVWFDRQVLATGTSYAERTQEWADRPRSEVRASVIRELKALSEASYAEARPELERLASEGAVQDCRRHWIVNSVTCRISGGDPSVLAGVPGVSKVFLAPPPHRSDDPEIGPRQVADSPVAEPFDPSGDPGTWNLQRLGIPKVWASGRTGKGVLVVVHDEGFRLDLPPISGTLYRNPGEIPDNGIDDEGDGYVDDVHGFAFGTGDTRINAPNQKEGRPIHGDAVAAVIAGRRAVGGRVTFGGAPDAVWAAVTANGAIEEAIEWSLEHRADVYSMSFSVGGLSDFRAHWRKVMEQSALAGLFLVSGAGNFGEQGSPEFQPLPVQMRIPEDVPLAVFGVTGIGRDGQRPAFSSQGPVEWSVEHYREGAVEKPDFATINQGIPVIGPDGRLMRRPGNGNSYAGPHMAAVLALMLEADPDLTPWAARRILIETAEDIGTPGFDHQFGHGLVDAWRAVRAVDARRGPPRR